LKVEGDVLEMKVGIFREKRVLCLLVCQDGKKLLELIDMETKMRERLITPGQIQAGSSIHVRDSRLYCLSLPNLYIFQDEDCRVGMYFNEFYHCLYVV
jgi:hypothetical protein